MRRAEALPGLPAKSEPPKLSMLPRSRRSRLSVSEYIEDLMAEVPTSRGTFLTHLGTSAGYLMYITSSCLFCVVERDHLFPLCSKVWPGRA